MYKMILEEIRGLADEEYKKFHGGLIPGVKTEFLGVRVPKLRAVAKRITKEEWREFLKEYENSTIYEIIMLYGMVLAKADCEFEEKLGYVRKFIPQIDNWAVCDVVCGDLKDIKKKLWSLLQVSGGPKISYIRMIQGFRLIQSALLLQLLQRHLLQKKNIPKTSS